MTTTNPTKATVRTPELRIDRLNLLAERDPTEAADQAWAWIVEAGRRALSDRENANAELAAMFAAGRPSTDINGATRGVLVTFTVHPLVDRFFATVTTAWMPWVGKRFDRASGVGDNVLARSARWPAKIPWPLYRTREVRDRLTAFDFSMRVEPSALDPGVEVLVIDYNAAGTPRESNPALIIRSIRDELVELVPGTHLGKMLLRLPSGEHHLLAYFALRSEL